MARSLKAHSFARRKSRSIAVATASIEIMASQIPGFLFNFMHAFFESFTGLRFIVCSMFSFPVELLYQGEPFLLQWFKDLNKYEGHAALVA